MEDRQKLLGPPQAAPPPYSYGPPGPNLSGPPPPAYHPQPQQQQIRQTTIVVERGRPIACATVSPPPDYTVLAVMAVICFFPLGLVALYMAGKVKESVAAGQVRNAWSEAITVRLLSRLSISIGTVLLTVIILAIVLPITLNG